MRRTLFKKRLFLQLSLLMLILVLIAACSKVGETEKAPKKGEIEEGNQAFDGQTLKVQLIGDFKEESATDPISGEKKEGVEVLKNEFERLYPGTKVEFIIMPWEGYAEKTQALITSKGLDVFQMPGLADFAPQGILEPLQPLIDKDKDFDESRFIDNQIEGWKVLGPESNELEIYGLPFMGDARFIAYDKQLFDEWGVEHLSKYPTMEEISEKAEKMTGKNPVTGEQNYGIWFRGDWDSAYRVINAAEGQNGSWGTGFSWDEIKFTFNSPEMLNGLNWLLEMQKFAPKGLVSNQGQEKWLTKENNIGIMLNQGPGDIIKTVPAQGLEERIGIVQEFKNDEGKGGLFAGSPIAISKDSKNKELAWEWLKFATSDFAQKYLHEEAGLIPSVNALTEWERFKELDLMNDIYEAMKTPWTPRYPWAAAQPRFILTSEIEAALTGKRTAKEALDKAQKESTDWLENR